MQSVIAWILMLHACHLPIPFPDLDGECRGAPIASMAELDAWHVIMLGVRPNDDVDRGPIRTHQESQEADQHQNPLGDPATLIAKTSELRLALALDLLPSLSSDRLGELVVAARLQPALQCSSQFTISDIRGRCISFCCWQV